MRTGTGLCNVHACTFQRVTDVSFLAAGDSRSVAAGHKSFFAPGGSLSSPFCRRVLTSFSSWPAYIPAGLTDRRSRLELNWSAIVDRGQLIATRRRMPAVWWIFLQKIARKICSVIYGRLQKISTIIWTIIFAKFAFVRRDYQNESAHTRLPS